MKKSKWTIGQRLWFMSLMFISNIAFVAVVSDLGIHSISNSLTNVAYSQLPAVKNMALADMMHDGLRANVYHAIIVSGLSDEVAIEKIKDKGRVLASNMKSHLEALDSLDISAETKAAVAPAIVEADRYAAVAENISNLALSGDKFGAIGEMANFNASFASLEVLLEQLAERIEAESMVVSASARSESKKSLIISIGAAVLGIIVGLILAFMTIKNLLSVLNEVVSNLSVTSGKINGASQEAESSAATLSEASAEQAASLQETMASAEEISAMITQNAESAARAKSTVENNDRATKDGSNAVVEMVSAIGEIKTTNEKILQQMESSNREFAEIVQIISEIGDKTKVINDIVFQTKLLSFNASVEAARAGEHGKGFAVVAEEVGNLAQMSGNAAKEITDMLSASIKRVNGIVDGTKTKIEQLVEVGRDKVSMGQQTAERCRKALENLSENAAKLTEMVTGIAHASNEQAQGVKEINSAISMLDKVTQQNSEVALRSSAQAESLLRETTILDSSMENLIAVVGGKDRKGLKRREANESSANHAETMVKSSAQSGAGVVSITSRKHKEKSPNFEKPIDIARENKMAAGSEMVPSYDSSGFEDF